MHAVSGNRIADVLHFNDNILKSHKIKHRCNIYEDTL